MSWLDGWTKNRADSKADDADPDLRPIRLSIPPAEAVARAEATISKLSRWAVVAADPAAGTLHATHATRVWRFVDDVHLRFEPDGSGTMIVGQSQSRVGKGDFGQNARNLRELAQALRDL
ncbi:MAG TPA: DUF1499 domain-containing protein [Isosphaeraceae bacterium]|jgi:uncharacterized protein (DUF1499 family)|nr:DUF1499 domain-containing protein [Isosphaeraceae bacterium]